MPDCPDRYSHLKQTDPEVYELIQEQIQAESTTLKMIPSENYVSFSVLEACGSPLTNKYCEGYPGARYYEGNQVVDLIEQLAIDRAKDLFGAEHANVQPYSGSPANMAVYRSLLKPGDKIMGMPVSDGGHLTHGWKVSFSGTDYEQIPYGPDHETGILDYDLIRDVALKERPKMIWAGTTAYPRHLDYEKFAEIARAVDAYLVADIAHINGLIVAGAHPDPVPHCDVVASTAHKMLRGPRAGFILSKIEDRYHDKYHPRSKLSLAKRIDRAIFPGLQGGPHMNIIAAMAAAFEEASTEEFRQYGHQVVANSKRLAQGLLDRGQKLASGGTDTHLLIMDFRDSQYTGKDFAQALARGGIIGNFNMVPGDTRKPFVTSGVRLGTPALTSMGMKEDEMDLVAGWIDKICRNMDSLDATVNEVRPQVAELCSQFSVPGMSETEPQLRHVRS